jgi:hypothetical protein
MANYALTTPNLNFGTSTTTVTQNVNIGDTVNDCPITDIWVSSTGTPLFTIDGNYYTWKQLHEMLPDGLPRATTEYVTEEEFNMSEEEYKTVTSGL